METKQLRMVVAIADAGGLTRAGRRLGLSQPAISQQLAALERELGVSLFSRAGTGVRPTAAGDLLCQVARQIVDKVDEAKRMLVDYDRDGGGALRIGAGAGICEHVLPTVWKSFAERVPSLDVLVVPGSIERSLQRLTAGEIDAAIVPGPANATKLRDLDLGRDELVAIASPEHPWASRARLQATDFADQPLIVQNRSGRTYRALEAVLLERGVFPRVVMELDSVSAVSATVRAGVGVAVIPKWAVRRDVEAGSLVASSIAKGLSRKWSLVLADEGFRQRSLRTFVQVASEVFPPLLGVA